MGAIHRRMNVGRQSCNGRNIGDYSDLLKKSPQDWVSLPFSFCPILILHTDAFLKRNAPTTIITTVLAPSAARHTSGWMAEVPSNP